MQRYALGIEYDGSQYYGWQHQTGKSTIQDCLQQALSQVADHSIEVSCAGRTDRGVHALQQVVHFDTSVSRPEQAWVLGTNTHLPNDITVTWVRPVDESFHARFSACSRSYRYIIYNQTIHSAVLRQLTTHFPYELDEQMMHQAAQLLVGEHDFSAYRDSQCQAKHPRRCIYTINVQRQQHLVMMDIKANAFLHHMVRNIIGVLFEIGQARQAPNWTEEVLLSRDRTQAGVTAAANGLYLTDVEYPEHFEIPSRSQVCLSPWAI